MIQRTEITRFIAVLLSTVMVLTGCALPPFATKNPSKATSSSSAGPATSLENIPPLSSVEAQSGKNVGNHAGGVLDIRELTATPPRAISVGSGGEVIAWDVRTGAARLINRLPSPPITATFAQTKALIAYSSGNTITVACVQGCSSEWKLTKIKARVASLAFHDNDESVIIGGTDGRIYRWRYIFETTASDVREREKSVERYLGHQTLISAVASLPVGRAFFSADWDGNLMGWLPYTADDYGGVYDKNIFGGSFFGQAASMMKAARQPDRGISSLSIAPDGSRVIVGTEDGSVEVWNVRGFNLAARARVHSGRVTSVTTNHDGSLIASVGRDGFVDVHRPEPDPQYRISAEALSYTVRSIAHERVDGVKSALLLSNETLLITTANGGIGELDFTKGEPRPSVVATISPAASLDRIEKDPDY